MLKPRQPGLKGWEKAIIALALFISLGAGIAYLTGFSLEKYLLGIVDEGHQKQIATLTQADGVVRRQRETENGFQTIEIAAPLFSEDTLVTSQESGARIDFTEGSYLQMAPGTMVRLSFATQFTIAGVVRTTNVQVIMGNVTGESKSEHFTVKNHSEKIDLKPPPPKPRPIPSPSPSPSPSLPVTTITFPKSGSHLSVLDRSVVAEVPITFKWEISQSNLLVDFRLIQPGKLPKSEPVFKKQFAMTSGQGQLPLALKIPGPYRIEIYSVNPPDILLAASDFTIDPEFEGIALENPLVGGVETNSSLMLGKLLKNFDITLSWSPYRTLKSYELYLYLHREATKPIWHGHINGNHYRLNQGKVFSGEIFYRVIGRLKTGFVVRSPLQGFEFDFLPPVPANPKDLTEYSKKALQRDQNRILFTWQKTNFTNEYEFEISTDQTFAKPLTQQKLSENFYSLKNPKPGTYYWRIRSLSSNGKSSEPSRVSKFTVGR